MLWVNGTNLTKQQKHFKALKEKKTSRSYTDTKLKLNLNK